jgi:peroxidase
LYGYLPLNPSQPYLFPPASHLSSPTYGLKVVYYDQKDKCPRAEKIMKKAVQKATAGEKAGLIRLFFHDYFVKVHTLLRNYTFLAVLLELYMHAW